MFKKLFSIATVLLFGFTVYAGAQHVEKVPVKQSFISAQNYARKPVTSNIDKKGNELWTGYWDGSLDMLDQVGAVEIPMDYSVAIKIKAGDKMTLNRTVEGIKFLFADHSNIEDVYVWISKSLPETPEMADICYQKVTNVTSFADYNDNINEIRFNTPYKVEENQDFYVGYAFSVNEGYGDDEKYPVVFYDSEDVDNSLYMLCGSDGWEDYSNDDFGPAAIQILVSGDFDSDGAVFTSCEDMMAPRGEDFGLPLTVKNMGTEGISTMDVKLELSNGDVYTYNVKPFDKVEGMYTEYEFGLKVPAPEEVQKYEYTATIEKVNGKENKLEGGVIKGNIQVLTRLAERKILFEEFTGMWCGWCPRGIIAMEKIGEEYGDKVARVAVHSSDPIKCKDYAKFVQSTVAGYPNAHVNRTVMGVDPYYGLDMDRQFAVKDIIDACLLGAPEAEVKATAVIDGNILTAQADVTFLYTGNADDYAMAYVLTEDGMQDENWSQTNNYAQFKGEDVEPIFQEWVDAPSKRYGVVYNEVAIAAQGIQDGIEASIPSEVTEEELNKHTVEFDLDSYPLIQDTEKMNIIAILLNTKTGKVVNVGMAHVNDVATGINDINVNKGDVVEVARYNAEGRRISASEKGLNIIKYSDGSFKKVFEK